MRAANDQARNSQPGARELPSGDLRTRKQPSQKLPINLSNTSQ